MNRLLSPWRRNPKPGSSSSKKIASCLPGGRASESTIRLDSFITEILSRLGRL
jgi:hypothetical protein